MSFDVGEVTDRLENELCSIPGYMALVYRCVGILAVDVVVFFRSSGVFHSQDSFPSTLRPRLWETSSGVVVVDVFAAMNTPTATTPEDFSHSRGRNVEGKES